MTQNIMCAAHASCNKGISPFFFVIQFYGEIISKAFILHDQMQYNYICVGDMDCIFCGGENRNVRSTTLTAHRPLKHGGQISQHLLIHPNLRFIIVP